MKFNFFKKVWGRKEKEDRSEETKKEIAGTEKGGKVEFIKVEDNFKIYPLITEKSLALAKQGKYVFGIEGEANRAQIKKMIREMFNVNVLKIYLINYHRRERGMSKIKSIRKKFKKAIIQLKEGEKIPLFE